MTGFDRVQRDPTFGSWSTVGWRFSREPAGRVPACEVVHPDGECGTRLTSRPANAAITRSRVVIVADPPYSTLLRTAQLELASGTGLFRQHPLDDRVVRSKPRRQDSQDSSIELLGLSVVCLAGVGFGDVIEGHRQVKVVGAEQSLEQIREAQIQRDGLIPAFPRQI